MIKLQFWFRYPYNKSYDEFQDLVSIWSIKILKGDSHAPFCLTEMDDKQFKRIFGFSYRKQKIDVPKIIQYFVIKIIAEDVNEKFEKTKRKTMDRK